MKKMRILNLEITKYGIYWFSKNGYCVNWLFEEYENWIKFAIFNIKYHKQIKEWGLNHD